MSNTNIHTVIGVDPGANGGIAIYQNGEVSLAKMPKTAKEFAELLKAFDKDKTLLFVEKVGIRPDDVRVDGSAANMGKIYRIQKMVANFEALITCIELSEMPYITVHPLKWQSGLELRRNGMEKAERKRYYKQLAQTLYLRTKQTLWSSDATLIMHFGLQCIKSNKAFLYSKLPKHHIKALFD